VTCHCLFPLGPLGGSLGLWEAEHQLIWISTPGIQSLDQKVALANHNPARPIFVEGPFSLWLRNKCIYYHILRADLPSPEERVRTRAHVGEGNGEGQHCPKAQ
jgi:hypothetical protein